MMEREASADGPPRTDEAEARLRAIAQALPDIVFLIDEDGRYRDILTANSHLLYREASALLGQRVADVFGPVESTFFQDIVDSTIAGTGPRLVEYSLQVPAGQRWFEGRVALYPGELDGKRAIVFLARDITDLREERRRRVALEEQLNEAKRLEAIGTLAGGVAHDFNNLHTTIQLCTLRLLEEFRKGHPLHEDARRILQASERAAELTAQLLAFGQRQMMRPRPTQLNEQVATHAARVERLLGDPIELYLDLAGDLPPIVADPTHLKQVLIHLAMNARDAMPSGGSVFVSTQGTPDGFVTLAFRDTGTGMSDEVLDRAFEPFFTTKAIGAGSGMGLAMVYGVVSQLGGEARIESAPERGTTVSLAFPVA